MMKPPSQSYQLDLRRYELRRADGVKVKLERQPMELLILFAEKTGRLVTREELAARLWPDGISVETEPAINNAIRKIRLALRDSADKPTHIETVVGKGYRFIGDLQVIDEQPVVAEATVEPAASPARAEPGRVAAGHRRLTWPMVGLVLLLAAGAIAVALGRSSRTSGHGAIRSIAVLPLKNVSGDPAQQYFADGMTDELTTNLAKIGSLRVISRTSTMQYAEHPKPMAQIAKELNVEGVIEGSVARAGGKVRVTARLIDARNDAHLWGQSYERDLGDVLELQNSVALDIASQVKSKLSREERGTLISHHSVNPEAFESYLRARNEIGRQTPESIRASVQHFQHAIDLDPFYAVAYAGLADAYSMLAMYDLLAPKAAFPRGEAAARKALDLEPSLAEAHTSLAFARHHFDWDWSGAEDEYRRALQLAPGFPIAHLRYAEYLSTSSRHSEAIREINRARDLDPLALTIASNVGSTLFHARRYDEAIREFRDLLSLHPERIYTRMFLGMAYEQKRMYPEAIAEHRRVMDRMGSEFAVDLAHAYAVSGQHETARRLLGDAMKSNSAGSLDWFFIASVYAALGDKDQAFVWLERAYENRDFFMTYLNVYPFFDPLRSDPRFRRLTERVGIPNYR